MNHLSLVMIAACIGAGTGVLLATTFKRFCSP